MDRYGVLRGTDKGGIYKGLGVSKGLSDYLTKLGATDPPRRSAPRWIT